MDVSEPFKAIWYVLLGQLTPLLISLRADLARISR